MVGAFNLGKALVGAFSVIVKTDCETDGSSAALVIAPPPRPCCHQVLVEVVRAGDQDH